LDDPPSAASALAEQLKRLNSARIRIGARHEVTERLLGAVSIVLPHLDARLAGARVPLSGDEQAGAKLADELLACLATSYKILLVEQARRLFGLASSGRALLPVQRTMALLARRLVLSYRTYASAPKGVWQEMHELYQFANRRGLANRVLEPGAATPSNVYKQALLLAFANPLRFMHGDLDIALALVERHGDRAHLTPSKDKQSGGGLFVIKPHRDVPGYAMVKHRHPALHSNDLMFDAGPVAQSLVLQSMDESGSSDTASPPASLDEHRGRTKSVVARLVGDWGSTPTRRISRLRTHARVDILVGLSAIWSFLNRAGSEEPSSEWIVTNESPRGFALLHTGGTVAPVYVGEVVGLRATGSTACHICVVRWVLSDNPEHIEVGLEEIATSARPVLVRLSDESAESEPALLLPDATADQPGPTLLTSVLPLDSTCEVSIGELQAKLRVQPTRILERTASVQLVQFSSVS
jgi:hypothetical protein